MVTDKQQNNNGREDRIRSGLKWIGSQIREVKFGTIRGAMIRDGVIVKGPLYRVIHTGKPRGRGSPINHDALDGEDVLLDAINDLRRDTAARRGEWTIELKVHKGIPVSWEMEETGRNTIATTN